MVHLGLGNFFRAHQAWYTHRAEQAERWGIAAFSGRNPRRDELLAAQSGRYTLVTRGPQADSFEVVSSLSAVFGVDDHRRWLGHLADPAVTVVTATVTEAGYRRGVGGRLDVADPRVQDDVAALRSDLTAPVVTAPARLLAGLIARRRADAGPLTVIPCDNLAANGATLEAVMVELAEAIEPALVPWLSESVTVVASMVDRITPNTTVEDLAVVAEQTGWADLTPVVTEPFHEWVIEDAFAGARPRWESGGAVFVDDVEPYENRKLWLLNGAHSLLAYLGSIRDHSTVSEAIDDEVCRRWVEGWWLEAGRHLGQPPADVLAYTAKLIDRFTNPRMAHLLAQIAMDGSQKLPVRILPAVRAERAEGRVAESAACVMAAWIVHLRGAGAPVADVRAPEVVPLAQGPLTIATRRVLAALDHELGEDDAFVGRVVELATEIEGTGSP